MALPMEWDEIKKRLRNGINYQILAELNGVTQDTLRYELKKHEEETGEKLNRTVIPKKCGELKKRLSEEVYIEAIRNRGNKSAREIANELGVSKPTVLNKIKKYGNLPPEEPEEKPKTPIKRNSEILLSIQAQIEGLEARENEIKEKLAEIQARKNEWKAILNAYEGGKIHGEFIRNQ